MSHQYKAGDVVTIFQVSASKELVIEGKATIRKKVADVDEQYKVEFAHKPGVTYERFVDSWDQDDRAANLWRAWQAYKDVAHLVTAATIITADARERAKVKPIGEFGPHARQLQPLHITMLMPDFVLSVALWLQEYGLKNIPQSREQPMLDPETLWRVPPDMNVVAVPPPARKIDAKSIAVLNARRAGNRGKSKPRKTTSGLS